MAIFHVVTFFIHAIVGAMAVTMGAVAARALALIAVIAGVLAIAVVACTSCGFGGAAVVKRRKGGPR